MGWEVDRWLIVILEMDGSSQPPGQSVRLLRLLRSKLRHLLNRRESSLRIIQLVWSQPLVVQTYRVTTQGNSLRMR